MARHINRELTADERERHAQARAAAERDFPPKKVAKRASPPGIPAIIRRARESRGMTWYAVAQAAGIPNQATIRDIELGKDVKLSNLQAVASVLGLELELVPSDAAT